MAFGGNNTAGPIDVATARNACASASGRMDFESETFLVQPIAAYSSSGAGYWREGIGALRGRQQDSHENVCCVTGDITHTLKAEGFDASEDGTGRGQPIVVHGTQDPCVSTDTAFALGRNNGGENVLAFDTTQITSAANRSNPQPGDPCHPLAAGAHPPAVAVQASQSGVRFNETVGTLDANYGSRRHNGVMQEMRVRRLTPAECEKLQGFPPGYTAIPWRKKPASDCPDGPRYKALGNSWAVPCVAWIGRRINNTLRIAA